VLGKNAMSSDLYPKKTRGLSIVLGTFSIKILGFSIEIMGFSIEIMSFFIEILAFSIEIMTFSIKILVFSIEIMSFFIKIMSFFIEILVFFIKILSFSIEIIGFLVCFVQVREQDPPFFSTIMGAYCSSKARQQRKTQKHTASMEQIEAVAVREHTCPASSRCGAIYLINAESLNMIDSRLVQGRLFERYP